MNPQNQNLFFLPPNFLPLSTKAPENMQYEYFLFSKHTLIFLKLFFFFWNLFINFLRKFPILLSPQLALGFFHQQNFQSSFVLVDNKLILTFVLWILYFCWHCHFPVLNFLFSTCLESLCIFAPFSPTIYQQKTISDFVRQNLNEAIWTKRTYIVKFLLYIVKFFSKGVSPLRQG